MACVVISNGYEVIGVLMPMTVYGEEFIHMPLNEGRSLAVCIGEELAPKVESVHP